MKNILFLINGLGIQTRDSYDIEINKCMPTLNELVSKQQFATIKSDTYDYKEGFAYFSVGSKLPITFLNVEKNTEFDKQINSDVVKELATNITTKLHIFCYFEDYGTYNHLKAFVKEISKINKKTIYVHLILCQKNMEKYEEIEKFISKMGYDMIEYAKVGLVLGESVFNNKDLIRDIDKTCYTEVAEIWKEVSIKIKSLVNNKVIPSDAKPFIINKGFRFENQDSFLFFNYNNKDLTTQIDTLKLNPVNRTTNEFKLYSLYPIKYTTQIKAVYNNAVSDTSFSKDLEFIGKTCLALCPKEQMNYINYYLNGYNGTPTNSIKFSSLDTDATKVLSYINNTNYDLYIISYDVGGTTDYTEFINSLKQVDNVLKSVSEYAITNNYSFFMSSLYGINKKLFENKLSRYINFSLKLPLILIDKNYPTTDYLIKDGNVYLLGKTILKNMNPSYSTDTLIMKKTKLSKLFRK